MRPTTSSTERATRLATLLVIALFVTSAVASAGSIITNNWIGGDAGDLNNPANWSAGAPASGQALTIIQSGPLSATLSANLVADSLTVHGEPGGAPTDFDLDMMGHMMTLEAPIDPLKIADGAGDARAAVTFTNGRVVTDPVSALRFIAGSISLEDTVVTTNTTEFFGPDPDDITELMLALSGEKARWEATSSITLQNALLQLDFRAEVEAPDIQLSNVLAESETWGRILGTVNFDETSPPSTIKGQLGISGVLTGPGVFEVPLEEPNPFSGGSTTLSGISGAADLQPMTLRISLKEGYVPEIRDGWTVFSAIGPTTPFGHLDFPDLDAAGFPGLGWKMFDYYNDDDGSGYRVIELVVVPLCEADLDYNGDVAANDIAELLSRWGPVDESSARFDLNGNGAIDAADLAELIGRWGPCPH